MKLIKHETPKVDGSMLSSIYDLHMPLNVRFLYDVPITVTTEPIGHDKT